MLLAIWVIGVIRVIRVIKVIRDSVLECMCLEVLLLLLFFFEHCFIHVFLANNLNFWHLQ
jgi:hypothetical protein